MPRDGKVYFQLEDGLNRSLYATRRVEDGRKAVIKVDVWSWEREEDLTDAKMLMKHALTNSFEHLIVPELEPARRVDRGALVALACPDYEPPCCGGSHLTHE